MRSVWRDLPVDVRDAVQEHSGHVTDVRPVNGGNHSDIACTLYSDSGAVFLKGAYAGGQSGESGIRSLRHEARIDPQMAQYAPRLLWHVEVGGWLLLGFEYMTGRHADFAPGSPDLHLIANIIEGLQATSCPDSVTRRIERPWSGFLSDISALAGESLIHMDLNPKNILVTAERAYVVDWAWACKGAAWAELGIFTTWLLDVGHTPKEADEWLRRFDAWRFADRKSIGILANANAERWRENASRDAPDWAKLIAHSAEIWQEYRLSQHG